MKPAPPLSKNLRYSHVFTHSPLRGRSRARYALVALLFATACSGGGGDAAPTGPPLGGPDPLTEIAREQGSVDVVVDLAVPRKADGTWDRDKIAKVQDRLLKALGDGVTLGARYETTPQLALAVNRGALKRLRASPLVLGVHLDEAD